LGSVANVAVFDSKTEQYRKGVAPNLGGTDAEVFDMALYGEDVLIAGNFAGPSSTQNNLVLVDGNTGRVIRWFDAPSLKSVEGARKLGRVYGGGGESLGIRFFHGQEALDQGEDRGRRHARPRQ
jgi:hypothetical protein